MKRLLFVVHRYAPYPGGSEYNVQRLAEETLRQGHDVTVLTDTHMGDYRGVKVTSDRSIAFQTWDMIFVHGSCPTQDFIHSNEEIGRNSPVYYLLVEPPKYFTGRELGTKNATWIGCGTTQDWNFVRERGLEDKARKFIYGIPTGIIFPDGRNVEASFKERYQINTNRMFISAGGFWPHKRMNELADTFRKADIPDCTLVLMGYDKEHGPLPTQSKNVVVLYGTTEQDVKDAMFDSDLYILNSESEGYGLVLLESMNFGVEWVARDIAAAHDLSQLNLGRIYNTQEELIELLRTPIYDPYRYWKLVEYVRTVHSIENSVNCLLSVLDE